MSDLSKDMAKGAVLIGGILLAFAGSARAHAVISDLNKGSMKAQLIELRSAAAEIPAPAASEATEQRQSTASSRRENRLICRSDANGNAALYNLDRQKFIDPYYSKTLDDCNLTAQSSRWGYTCASNSDGKTAIYDLEADKFVDAYFSRVLSECLDELRYERGPLRCRAGSDGTAALYDHERQKFIDRFYSKTFDECRRTVRASRRGLTCATKDGKAAIFDYRNDEFVDSYYAKTLEECLESIR